jgi:site-specific DNA-methyltransferase (adenine-specific)
MIRIETSDNLDFLRSIEPNSVDLIYCDILYGTGHDFGDYKDLAHDRKVITSHYLPRLTEMHRVLKDTGLIYLQMDFRISHWIRIMMDDIFGLSNFRNEIIWEYKSAPRKKHSFGYRHDTILRYSKSNEFFFEPIRVPYSESAPRGYEKETYYHADGKVVGDVWDIPMIAQNDKTERVKYKTQKPKALLERIIKSSSKEGDVVADFYLGSGTTAVVAIEMNRSFLGCDVNEHAVNLTNERISKIPTKLF